MGVSVMHSVLAMHIEQRAFPRGNHRLGPQRGCARGHSPDLRDAALAHRLNIKAIQVAERDFQVAKSRKARNEFVDTWSVDAFVEEGMQPAEPRWGTHERHWPADAHRHG
ncbi:homospermidine synthase [Paraburkholderia sp. RAU6.4a]|uniref:hypothetical protein n=1 Tax=Paraburkholderia sp. RAU6.4a TaxID=2991067 RepID=UPI003D1F9ECF